MRDLGPLPISQAPSNTPSLTTYLHVSLAQMVQELELDQVLTLFKHVRDLGPLPINKAPQNIPSLTTHTYL